MYELAQNYCSNSCKNYHEMWQYFRLIGLISTISTDDDFLTETFRSYAREGSHSKILISASADYGMLARIINAYKKEKAPVDITILDLCNTPLEINKWYALKNGVEISVWQGDIVDFNSEFTFDLVCTHSFIGLLPEMKRKLAIRKWYSLLRKGGKVVTTARIRHESMSDTVNFSLKEATAFRDKALKLLKHVDSETPLDSNVIADGAFEYALNKKSSPIHTPDILESYFKDAGFENIELIEPLNSTADKPSGPIKGKKSARYRIIAHRQ